MQRIEEEGQEPEIPVTGWEVQEGSVYHSTKERS